MKPEELARLEIDRQLTAAGWLVQDRREMNISAGLGVAVREFPLTTGPVDYMLYADAKALGVVEAKPVGHPLKGVETQSGKYLQGLPANLPHYRLPLPFAYESTGALTQFTNNLEPDARSRPVFTFHTPAELIRLATLEGGLGPHSRFVQSILMDSGAIGEAICERGWRGRTCWGAVTAENDATTALAGREGRGGRARIRGFAPHSRLVHYRHS